MQKYAGTDIGESLLFELQNMELKSVQHKQRLMQ